MTIEELLKCSAAELEAMSDIELEQHLSKYFCVTRPTKEQMEEQQQKMVKDNARPSRPKTKRDDTMERLAKLAGQLGLEV